MASLQQKKSGWYCQFRFEKKRYTFALGPVAREEAEAKASHVEYLLLRLRQGLLEIPPDVDVVEFVRHDGTPPAKRTVHRAGTRRSGTLGELRDRYLATHEGAHEKSSLDTAAIHFKHLIETLGDDYRLSGLAQADLQKHIDRRAVRGVSPETAKKEIHGLRAAWNWGRAAGIVDGDWPGGASSTARPGRSRTSRRATRFGGRSPAAALPTNRSRNSGNRSISRPTSSLRSSST